MMRRRVATLALVLLAPATALTAPAATAATGPAVVLSGPAVVRPQLSAEYTWTATDDGPGPLSYQVRTGTRPHGGTSISWGEPRDVEGDAWSLVLVRPPQEACLEVVATDFDGDTGTASACTYVDETAPWLGWVGSWPPISSQPAGAPVTLRYRATDDDRVASYDVLTRLALAGRAWGAWTAPQSWQRTTATAVSRVWPAGSNVCFLVRARDRVGNLARSYPSLGTRCTAIPYDDRRLVRSTTARALRETWALSGTTTLLAGTASLRTGRVTARTVWIAMRGQGGYCPRLWFAGHRIADWRCSWYPIGRRSWFRFTLPRTTTGAAVIRAGRYDRVRVDAVTVARW